MSYESLRAAPLPPVVDIARKGSKERSRTANGRWWESSKQMRSLLTLVLALILAAPGFSDASAGGTAAVARVAQRLQGTWDCRGPVPGSTSREVYVRAGEKRIVLHNAVHTARGLRGVVVETFGYDPQTATWELSAPMNRFFDVMQLGAHGWRAQQWVFTGTQTLQNVVRPTRIVYTSLGPNLYRREHQSQERGVWQADGAFVCRRFAPTPTKFVPAIAVRRKPIAIPSEHVALTARGAPASSAPPRMSRTPQTARVPTARMVPTGRPPPPRVPQTPPTSLRPRTPQTPWTQPMPRTPPTAREPRALRGTPVRRSPPVSRNPATRVALGMRAPRAVTVTPDDQASSLIGVWSCRTFGGLSATHTFTRRPDRAISLHNVLRIGDRDYDIDEIYRFRGSDGTWSNVTQGGAYVGTAGRWLGSTWVSTAALRIAMSACR